MDVISQPHTLRRYALAHALIPDADEADELFRLSRDEADLRRRASRWLAQRGQMLPELDPPLPLLDAEQQAHALHLARLGRKRRLALPLAIGAIALLLVLLPFLGRLWNRPVLATAAVYQAKPVAEGPVGDLHLAVYRAELNESTGRLSVWWELSGPGAGNAANTVRPTAKVQALQTMEWLAPVHTLVEQAGRQRVLGRSDYSLSLPLGNRLSLVVGRLGARAATWDATVPLVHQGHSPAERRIDLNRTLQGAYSQGTVDAITLAPTYTIVAYHGAMRGLSPGQRIHLYLGSSEVAWLGAEGDGGGAGREIFAGLGAGAERVKLTFNPFTKDSIMMLNNSIVALGNGTAPGVRQWQRQGFDLTATVATKIPQTWRGGAPPQAYLLGPANLLMNTTLLSMVSKQGSDTSDLTFQAHVDPTTQLDRLQLSYPVPAEQFALQTDINLGP